MYSGWQVDWEPDHIRPQSMVPALQLVSLGNDVPGQGHASDRNELCRLLYTFGTICGDNFHMCIYATSSHILTCNIKKCDMDYFLCRPIYAYPHMINVMYYDTVVLIWNNYFCHQISEVVHLPWVYVDIDRERLCPYMKWYSAISVFLELCLWYICIILYVKCIQCITVAWIYDQLMGDPYAFGIFAFSYM